MTEPTPTVCLLHCYLNVIGRKSNLEYRDIFLSNEVDNGVVPSFLFGYMRPVKESQASPR